MGRSVGCPYDGFVTHFLGYVRSGSNRTVCSFSVPVDGQLANASPQMRAHGVLATPHAAASTRTNTAAASAVAQGSTNPLVKQVVGDPATKSRKFFVKSVSTIALSVATSRRTEKEGCRETPTRKISDSHKLPGVEDDFHK